GIVTIGASAAATVSPPALPALSAPPDIWIDEADGYVDLPVTLSAPSVNPVTVTFATQSITATPGTNCSADFVNTTGTLTFAPGETTKAVRVQVLDCPQVEGVVTFRLRLSSQVNATIARMDAIVSIVDNNTAWTPNNTALPTVGGTILLGQTLTATPGTWTGAPTSYQYSWQRCNSSGSSCGTIGGATASTYVLTTDDFGHRFRVQVTATNSLGTSPPAFSLATAALVSVPTAPLNVLAVPGDGQVTV